MWNLVFGRFPAELFNDHFLAHELLRFLRLNLESLHLRVPQYTHFFPNLLKVKTRPHGLTVVAAAVCGFHKLPAFRLSVCLCSCWHGTARHWWTTLWICCPLWLQLALQWSFSTPCWTCPVSLPPSPCNSGHTHKHTHIRAQLPK